MAEPLSLNFYNLYSHVMKFFSISQNTAILIALVFGVITPFLHLDLLLASAHIISVITIKTLQLVSLPLIFLSVVATLSGMENLKKLKSLGAKVFKYTLLTTITASTLACLLYLFMGQPAPLPGIDQSNKTNPNLLETVLSLYPSNVLGTFTEGNVFGVMLLALSLGTAILVLPPEQKEGLNNFFSSLFSAFLKIASFIIRFIPLGIWAFVSLFVQKVLSDGVTNYKPIVTFLIIVCTANLIQGIVVLPLLLLSKGISPKKVFVAVAGALNVAFSSKSSNATLPITLNLMEKRLNIPSKISSFALPLCTTINMNGCAAFIFTAVVYLSALNGVIFSPIQLIAWILIATIAAIGNAGVPMGCFFLSSALLAGVGVPLELMGVILPFYTLIDMLETALNVWSDCCVTAIVAKELQVAESIR